MEIPTERAEDFINELSICIKVQLILLKYLREKNILGRTCLEKSFIQSLSAYNAPLQREHIRRYIPLSTHISKRFHLWYVIRLLYSILICSLCSQASLLKARVGNMTHVVQSFQPLCYSNKQLFCVPSQLDFQNPALSPSPDTRAATLWGQAYFVKTNTWLDLSSCRQTWLGRQKQWAASQSQ